MVYCATVPNGTLICRRNGLSFIAGNCFVYAFAAACKRNLEHMTDLGWRVYEATLDAGLDAESADAGPPSGQSETGRPHEPTIRTPTEGAQPAPEPDPERPHVIVTPKQPGRTTTTVRLGNRPGGWLGRR
jgi:hypothetical protein